MSGAPEAGKAIEIDDTPRRDGADKYGIYIVRAGQRRKVAETSLDGIGATIEWLEGEDQIMRGDKIGIFNRETRKWMLNPWL